MSRRVVWPIGGVLAIILAGMVVAWRLDLGPSADPNVTIRFTEIILGKLPDDVEPPGRQYVYQPENFYEPTDNVGLRVVTEVTPVRDVELGVRLLTETGAIEKLNPGTITVSPGISGYCCWQITTPGIYTFQIFRPDELITSLPLTIRQFGAAPATFQ